MPYRDEYNLQANLQPQIPQDVSYVLDGGALIQTKSMENLADS